MQARLGGSLTAGIDLLLGPLAGVVWGASVTSLGLGWRWPRPSRRWP